MSFSYLQILQDLGYSDWGTLWTHQLPQRIVAFANSQKHPQRNLEMEQTCSRYHARASLHLIHRGFQARNKTPSFSVEATRVLRNSWRTEVPKHIQGGSRIHPEGSKLWSLFLTLLRTALGYPYSLIKDSSGISLFFTLLTLLRTPLGSPCSLPC